jgi:hypothetical protein
MKTGQEPEGLKKVTEICTYIRNALDTFSGSFTLVTNDSE